MHGLSVTAPHVRGAYFYLTTAYRAMYWWRLFVMFVQAGPSIVTHGGTTSIRRFISLNVGIPSSLHLSYSRLHPLLFPHPDRKRAASLTSNHAILSA